MQEIYILKVSFRTFFISEILEYHDLKDNVIFFSRNARKNL